MTAAEGNVTNLPAIMRVRVRLRLDGSVERDGYAPQRLTRVESRLLLALARRSTCLSKEVLYSELYSSRAPADMPEPKIVDVFVCKLRRKLAACGAAEMIRTVWGRGHVLFDPSPAAVASARAAHRPEKTAEPAPRGWERRVEAVRLSA